jgi:hypothetical protein
MKVRSQISSQNQQQWTSHIISSRIQLTTHNEQEKSSKVIVSTTIFCCTRGWYRHWPNLSIFNFFKLEQILNKKGLSEVSFTWFIKQVVFGTTEGQRSAGDEQRMDDINEWCQHHGSIKQTLESIHGICGRHQWAVNRRLDGWKFEGVLLSPSKQGRS